MSAFDALRTFRDHGSSKATRAPRPVTCLLALISAATASPSVACSIVIPPNWGPAEFRKIAEDTVRSATAVIDGEVVRPAIPGQQTALVRAVRVFKGPNKTEFEIGERDSCSVLLNRVGERRRMLLVGGPNVYELNNDGANARYEDRLLRSDRRKDWPYRVGSTAQSH